MRTAGRPPGRHSLYVIVSLRSDAPTLHSYRIVDEVIIEEVVSLVGG